MTRIVGLLVLAILLEATLSRSVSYAQRRNRNSALSAGNARTNTNPAANLLNQALYNRPTVSPYLNLTRPGGNITPNYQSLVRPQMDQLRVNRAQRASTANLQRELSNDRHQAVVPGQSIRGTGHVTNFMSYSQYFNTLSSSSRP